MIFRLYLKCKLSQEEYERLHEGSSFCFSISRNLPSGSLQKYHTKGKKSNFDYRFTPDRIGKAGIHKIGLAALLGLEDWRTDIFLTPCI
jgi:2-iminoacetate synthase